jgi:hypothetical protein
MHKSLKDIVVFKENIKYLSESQIQKITDFLLSHACNSVAFNDLNFNLFVSEYFLLETEILIAKENDRIIGMLIYSIDAENKVFASPYQKSLSTYGGPIYSFEHEDVAQRLLLELKSLARKKNFSVYIKSGPKTKPQVYQGLGFKVNTIPTLLINVSKTEEELWSELENRIKRNIKKAWKEDITVHINEVSFDELIRIYKELSLEKKLHFQGNEYFKRLEKLVFSSSDNRIFYAKKGNTVVSAMTVLCFKDTINPWFGATSREYIKTGAGSLVYWEILKYASLKGYKLYDFLGLDVGPIAFYKKGFGGYEEEVVHATYRPLLVKVKNKIKKILCF